MYYNSNPNLKKRQREVNRKIRQLNKNGRYLFKQIDRIIQPFEDGKGLILLVYIEGVDKVTGKRNLYRVDTGKLDKNINSMFNNFAGKEINEYPNVTVAFSSNFEEAIGYNDGDIKTV